MGLTIITFIIFLFCLYVAIKYREKLKTDTALFRSIQGFVIMYSALYIVHGFFGVFYDPAGHKEFMTKTLPVGVTIATFLQAVGLRVGYKEGTRDDLRLGEIIFITTFIGVLTYFGT